ncbi:mucin-5AC [Nilaparvata lugens]|uniref:mucin-5AC n=1 Tax=Nilaparvata lugens TaxID=108931 RepID=UPI00193E5F53|nr:mucin-5AC [Nilaparvata lugens]
MIACVLQVCAKVFGNASALAKHKLTHSDERKYVCSMCGKAFKRQDHLNGHMLTHRNKKPYECKAEGCGKSYCDARSLRRHTENHHSTAASTTSPASPVPGSSCIQYAPPPTTTAASSTATSTTTTSASKPAAPTSQLQRLLASEPSNSPSSSSGSSKGSSSEGLTKQQLDLFHQIMQQTQLQQHKSSSSVVSTSTTVSTTTATSTTSTTTTASSKVASVTTPLTINTSKTKTWTVQVTKATTYGSLSKPTTVTNVSTVVAASSGAVGSSAASTQLVVTTAPAQKPVECNLCHRKFKNIPALNGHMRLHGGYFKKDSDSKKCEKKETTGPPLQTASMSVRALIEEKIIQKRITNPSLAAHTQTNLTYSTAETSSRTVPQSQYPGTPPSDELNIKISSFVVPATPTTVAANVSGCGDRTGLRRHSDSEHFVPPRTPTLADADGCKKQSLTVAVATSVSAGTKMAVNSLIKRASSDPGVLPERYHQQLQTNCILLPSYRNMELIPAHRKPMRAAALQDIASLEEYQNSPNSQHFQHHQDLQSVLNSPLPVGLADFAYSHNQGGGGGSHKDNGFNSSDTKDFVGYPQSPLPSPSFTYPTPPASQEGQSPSFGPLQSVISQGPVSSPLSAAFYTSAMSSSAAVEAALNEVLPLDSSQNVYPSPPPQSPLSATPVPSPLSLPASSSSPLPHALQSQMMPGSDDPLLSSSPKDFASKKRFDFQTFKVLNNGTVDLGSAGSQSLTGIVLDRNGELKLVTSYQPIKTSAVVNGTTAVFVNTRPKAELVGCGDGGGRLLKTGKVVTGRLLTTSQQLRAANIGTTHHTNIGTTHHTNIGTTHHTNIGTTHHTNIGTTHHTNIGTTHPTTIKLLDHIKEEIDDDVFLSPTTIAASPVRYPRKRPRLDGHSLCYPSRLRSTRHSTAALPYTPPPLLPPTRNGQGLYWQSITTWPSSTTFKGELSSGEDMAPESDALPHINIGPQHQAAIPPCNGNQVTDERDPLHEHLLWDPGISKLTSDNEVEMYLDFACCAAVPGGGRNKEYALHLLHLCNGNIHEAMLKLMQPTPSLPAGHPLLSFEYTDSERWSAYEMEVFHQGLLKYDKDFSCIAQEVGSKTVKQCVQFYYLWKKICAEDYKRLRLSRRKNKETDYDFDYIKTDIPASDVELVSTSSESRLFVCEYPDCSASFNSRAALNGHIRIHGGGTCNRCPTPDRRQLGHHPEPIDEFPCKICGKVFNKVKSRSAHMKSHRPPDAEPKKPKLDPHKLEMAEQTVGRAMGVTSSISVQRHS